MIKNVILAISLLLITGIAQAQPSAELEAQAVDEHTFRINLNIDDVENVFGLQAKFIFLDSNLVPVSKAFVHADSWSENSKIQLRNFIKSDTAEYAVSLVRPAEAIELSGSILSFDVKLTDIRPTSILLDTLKISDIDGNVTQFEVANPKLVIGETKNHIGYIVAGSFLLITLLLLVLRSRRHVHTRVPV